MTERGVQVPDGDRDVETVDLDAVESRRQVMLATADVGEALGGNAAIRNQLVLEMGKAAGRSANDVPALVAEVRRLRAALASQPAQLGDGVAEAVARERDRIAAAIESVCLSEHHIAPDIDIVCGRCAKTARVARTTTGEAES